MMGKQKPEKDEQVSRDFKQSTDVFWHLVENANQAIVISRDGMVKYFNPQTLEWTGYSEKEVMTTPFIEFIHPEDRDLVMTEYQDRISGVKKSSHYSLRVLTKSGEVRWAAVNSVLFEWEGKPSALTMLTDITEQKEAEAALSVKSRLLEQSQRVARLGSWEWNILTNELEWSEEVYRIFGLSSQKFRASYEAFLMSVHPDDREAVKEAVNHALSDPSFEYNLAHRIARPDGSEALVRERGKVVFTEEGRASRMIGTVQDITDIKMMETEARRLRTELSRVDRLGMIGVLTASIAHEINQPLTAILSNAQAALRFLTDDPPDLDEVKEALQEIISDDKRAGEIVRSIRSMMGRSGLKQERMDFNESVSEVLSLIRSEILLRNISLSEDPHPDIPPVYGNRISIQQVILNLVINALEAIESHPTENPEILVSTRFEPSEGIILSVSDTGPGIKPDHFASIFDSFHTTKTGGLGMGLSICKTIVGKHGGKIWAENHSQGGCTFSFSLPSKEDWNAK
jgi:PAS domain S-box-containing protein